MKIEQTLTRWVIQDSKLGHITGGKATADGPRYVVTDKKP